MDEELLNSIYESVRQQAERLITCHTSGNWLLIEMNGLLHASMCFPGIKGTDTWHDFAADKLVAEVDRQFYEDGMHYELSTLYHEVAINNYCRYVCMAQALGKKVPEKITATLRKACLAEVLLMMPDGRLPNLNDGEWFDVATLLSSRPDGLVDDEILFWLMDGTTTPPTSLEGHHNHLFSHAGLVVMRDGWGKVTAGRLWMRVRLVLDTSMKTSSRFSTTLVASFC